MREKNVDFCISKPRPASSYVSRTFGATDRSQHKTSYLGAIGRRAVWKIVLRARIWPSDCMAAR